MLAGAPLLGVLLLSGWAVHAWRCPEQQGQGGEAHRLHAVPPGILRLQDAKRWAREVALEPAGLKCNFVHIARWRHAATFAMHCTERADVDLAETAAGCFDPRSVGLQINFT